ncbi:hypothetical protein Rsub_04873 [Raphidocelis subcapitata]|uniref:Metallothionein n=1 Tax=Raphidocelis subcapitata TaxID=307507 RepID=A0A2V0NU85_9CHLO|nr:hypothetical protein Rsub_04873 [Raphidocelis subcapitata]|eukprot:GBF91204.1 hypothetical protein Rsub_04873 [Raphidocelis subcapitata]
MPCVKCTEGCACTADACACTRECTCKGCPGGARSREAESGCPHCAPTVCTCDAGGKCPCGPGCRCEACASYAKA